MYCHKLNFPSKKIYSGMAQRILNYLDRTRLSCYRMIWLPPPPRPLSRQYKLFWQHWERQPADLGGERGWGGAKSNVRKKDWSSILSGYGFGSAAECTYVFEKIRIAELRLLAEWKKNTLFRYLLRKVIILPSFSRYHYLKTAQIRVLFRMKKVSPADRAEKMHSCTW